MWVWPGMPNKSVFYGFYQWLKKRIHIARQYGSRCNIDSFLLNKKGLEELSILHKNFCNMHIARRNMHIATESTLRLTYTTCLFLYRLSLQSPSSFLSLVLLNNILVKSMSYWTSMTAKYCHSDVSLDQCSSSPFRTSFSPDGHFRTRPRNLAGGVTILIWLNGQVYRAQYILVHSNSYPLHEHSPLSLAIGNAVSKVLKRQFFRRMSIRML